VTIVPLALNASSLAMMILRLVPPVSTVEPTPKTMVSTAQPELIVRSKSEEIPHLVNPVYPASTVAQMDWPALVAWAAQISPSALMVIIAVEVPPMVLQVTMEVNAHQEIIALLDLPTKSPALLANIVQLPGFLIQPLSLIAMMAIIAS